MTILTHENLFDKFSIDYSKHKKYLNRVRMY